MPTIKVRVSGKIAENLTPEEKLVCWNEDYEVEFDFDESWAGVNFKTGLFIRNGELIAQPFDGKICAVPRIENTTLLAVGVKSSDGRLFTTTPAFVDCLKSASDLATNKIPAPTKDVYDEIIALINKYIGQGGGGSGEGVDLRDYQKKVDNALETTDKTIVGAINEVNDKVGQGGSGSAEVEFGETKGTAYEGHKGKQNADNIAGLQEMVNSFNADLADLTGKVDLMQPKSDETLPTESKEIVGAIKELYEREDKQGLTEEQVKEIVKETAVTQESDPTVPEWAKQAEKPTYTYEEITQKPDLVEDIGASIAEETNVLTIELKDKRGKVIESTEVVIPKGEVPDLSAYVKNTDYAKGVSTSGDANKFASGIVSIAPWGQGGIAVNSSTKGELITIKATHDIIDARAPSNYLDGGTKGANHCRPITPAVLDYAVISVLTDCKIELTDDQKAKIRALIGIE